MENYKKGKNVEEELTKDRIPIDILPESFLWMHVKGGTKVANVVEYAEKAFNSGEYRSVVWSGSGGGVPKTISCAEIMKRNYDVHQVTQLAYQKSDEYWDPILKGLDPIIVTRQVPAIHILLSLDDIDVKTPSYQKSKTPSKFWPEPQAKHQKKDEDYIYKNKQNGNKRNNNHNKQKNCNDQKKSSSTNARNSGNKNKGQHEAAPPQPGPSSSKSNDIQS